MNRQSWVLLMAAWALSGLALAQSPLKGTRLVGLEEAVEVYYDLEFEDDEEEEAWAQGVADRIAEKLLATLKEAQIPLSPSWPSRLAPTDLYPRVRVQILALEGNTVWAYTLLMALYQGYNPRTGTGGIVWHPVSFPFLRLLAQEEADEENVTERVLSDLEELLEELVQAYREANP